VVANGARAVLTGEGVDDGVTDRRRWLLDDEDAAESSDDRGRVSAASRATASVSSGTGASARLTARTCAV
jgi:hypothetical protein